MVVVVVLGREGGWVRVDVLPGYKWEETVTLSIALDFLELRRI